MIICLILPSFAGAGSLVKKRQNLPVESVDGLYSVILKERERGTHPLVLIKNSKYRGVFGSMNSEEGLRSYMRFLSAYVNDLNESKPKLRDLLDFKAVNEYWVDIAQKSQQVQIPGVLTAKDQLRNMDTMELFHFLKKMEAGTFHWDWFDRFDRSYKLQGQSFNYLFAKEAVEALAEHILQNPKILEAIYYDRSSGASMVRFRVMEELAGKGLLSKELRLMFIENLGINDFKNLNKLLSNVGFPSRFFRVISLMKKEEKIVRDQLVEFINRYPDHAISFLHSLDGKSSRRMIDGFADVLFRSNAPGISKIQIMFLQKTKFHLSTESVIFHASESFVRSGGEFSDQVKLQINEYRKQASLAKRCSLLFKRRLAN
jgi:hypothetical protein